MGPGPRPRPGGTGPDEWCGLAPRRRRRQYLAPYHPQVRRRHRGDTAMTPDVRIPPTLQAGHLRETRPVAECRKESLVAETHQRQALSPVGGARQRRRAHPWHCPHQAHTGVRYRPSPIAHLHTSRLACLASSGMQGADTGLHPRPRTGTPAREEQPGVWAQARLRPQRILERALARCPLWALPLDPPAGYQRPPSRRTSPRLDAIVALGVALQVWIGVGPRA